MAYNTKSIVKDKDGNPISQYYNPNTDQYEPVEGAGGGNAVVLYNADGTENNSLSLQPILDKLSQLTGTVIDEETRKSNEVTREDNEQLRIQLYNDLIGELDRISQIQEQVPQSVLDAVSNLESKIGELQDLDTTEKSNLVLALNEVYDDLQSVQDDLVAHKAEKASQDKLGHIKGGTLFPIINGIPRVSTIWGGYILLPDSSTPETDLLVLPSTNMVYYWGFVSNKQGYPATHGSVYGFAHSGNLYAYSWQIFHGASASVMHRRYAISATQWSEWKVIQEV